MMTTESNGQIVNMPVVKLYNQVDSREERPELIEKNHQTLCEMLSKRMAAELAEPEIIEAIVLKSGGVLRELVRIARKCCQICLREIRKSETLEKIKIDRDIFDQAVKSIRLDFEALLGKADYEILQQVYQNYSPDDQKAQPFFDLLHTLHILEYQNGDIWYDVHPVVLDSMKRKGLIEG